MQSKKKEKDQSSDGLRLNKLISDAGVCSRRQADAYIEAGRVTINGRKACIGQKVLNSDEVRVDGRVIKEKEDDVYVLLNKPVGIVCTTDRDEPDNVLDYMLFPKRIFPVGRLDKDSEGLLLLTNNGDIVNKMLRAGNQHQKEYQVTVNKPITDDFVTKMSSGVPILGVMTRKCDVVKTGEYRFSITLIQGLNRQIRRMCEFLGYEVTHLKRVRIMHLHLGKLAVGDWRLLTPEEIQVLFSMVKDSRSEPTKKKHHVSTNKKTESETRKKPEKQGINHPKKSNSMKRGSSTTAGKTRQSGQKQRSHSSKRK